MFSSVLLLLPFALSSPFSGLGVIWIAFEFDVVEYLVVDDCNNSFLRIFVMFCVVDAADDDDNDEDDDDTSMALVL